MAEDLSLIYCADPDGDASGGYKERVITLTRSWRPDLVHIKNGLHLVGLDGITYKVKQSDLQALPSRAEILVGAADGERHSSAKMSVADWLRRQELPATPGMGNFIYTDETGAEGNHVQNPGTDNGNGSGWAYPDQDQGAG